MQPNRTESEESSRVEQNPVGRATPKSTEQRSGGRHHEAGPARPLPVAWDGSAAREFGRRLWKRSDSGPPFSHRRSERGRGGGATQLGLDALLRGHRRGRYRRGRWVPGVLWP